MSLLGKKYTPLLLVYFFNLLESCYCFVVKCVGYQLNIIGKKIPLLRFYVLLYFVEGGYSTKMGNISDQTLEQ